MFRVIIQFIKKFKFVTGFLYILIIDCQKMAEVYRRKFALTAVTLFYSRIISKKFISENKTTFRKLEKSVKFSVKCDVDIKFYN